MPFTLIASVDYNYKIKLAGNKRNLIILCKRYAKYFHFAKMNDCFTYYTVYAWIQ